MTYLILPQSRQSELEAINATRTLQRCEPVETSDGVLLIPSNLKSCPCWKAYHGFLNTLEVFDDEPVWKEVE